MLMLATQQQELNWHPAPSVTLCVWTCQSSSTMNVFEERKCMLSLFLVLLAPTRSSYAPLFFFFLFNLLDVSSQFWPHLRTHRFTQVFASFKNTNIYYDQKGSVVFWQMFSLEKYNALNEHFIRNTRTLAYSPNYSVTWQQQLNV